jgi:serine/threonine protein phosphatase PrpC
MEKQELKEIFNDDRLSLEEMKNKIYDSAVNKGSDDNISLILVRKVH